MSPLPAHYSKGVTFFGHVFFVSGIGVLQVIRSVPAASKRIVRVFLSDLRLSFASLEPQIASLPGFG